tara:strand:- start:736 stop:1023 length:288 start_codon:yes stop_codon:yes gene_type:complete
MYKILPYSFQRAKEINVKILPSENLTKKIDVYKDNKKVASIGAKGYMDYPTYTKLKGKEYADIRRKLYYGRHANEKVKDKEGNYTPSYYAKKILW